MSSDMSDTTASQATASLSTPTTSLIATSPVPSAPFKFVITSSSLPGSSPPSRMKGKGRAQDASGPFAYRHTAKAGDKQDLGFVPIIPPPRYGDHRDKPKAKVHGSQATALRKTSGSGSRRYPHSPSTKNNDGSKSADDPDKEEKNDKDVGDARRRMEPLVQHMVAMNLNEIPPALPPAASVDLAIPSRQVHIDDSIIYRLPIEIWIRIFLVLGSNPADLLRAQTVCRTLKPAAEEALFHRIYVHSDAQLHLLTTRLLAGHGLLSGGAGTVIRSLWLDVLGSTTHSLSATSSSHRNLMLLIVAATNLREFKMHNAITSRILLGLLQNAGRSLQVLHIVFCEQKPSELVSVLNELTALVELKLHIGVGGSIDYPNGATIELPSVRSLVLECSTCSVPGVHEHGFIIISRSHFHPKCAVEVNMPTLTTHEAAKLAPLFRSHACSQLTLTCPHLALHELVSAMSSIPDIRYPSYVPPPCMFTQKLPSELYINVRRGHVDNFWKLMQYFTTLPEGAKHIMKLHLWFAEGPPFVWAQNATEDQICIKGRLIPYVTKLIRRGILIIDTEGHDLGSLTTM